MRISFKQGRSCCSYRRWRWHLWFAWRPVKVAHEWVWLERIERKLTMPDIPVLVGPYWEYR